MFTQLTRAGRPHGPFPSTAGETLRRTFPPSRSLLYALLSVALVGSSMALAAARISPIPPQGNTPVPAKPTPFRNQPSRIANRARAYYGLVWGIEALSVKVVESGEMVRFSYRVLDAEKAKPLNDKKLEPVLISPERGVKLIIPSLEKVGQLRQSSTPESGKSYWMAFSNKGAHSTQCSGSKGKKSILASPDWAAPTVEPSESTRGTKSLDKQKAPRAIPIRKISVHMGLA